MVIASFSVPNPDYPILDRKDNTALCDPRANVAASINNTPWHHSQSTAGSPQIWHLESNLHGPILQWEDSQMSCIHKMHLATYIIASNISAMWPRTSSRFLSRTMGGYEAKWYVHLGVKAYLEAVSQLVCVHVPYIDIHIIATRHQHGILVTERERERERERRHLLCCMLSLLHTCQVYTLTIFSKVTSTHTAIMMPENYRTLRPVNSKTSPRNHMERKEVGMHPLWRNQTLHQRTLIQV